MEIELLKILGAGGDLATVVVAWAIWKLDRRLFKIEFQCLEKKIDGHKKLVGK